MTYINIRKENIKNIGEGYIYEHKKTGAKIVYIKNDDKNKVFSIAFRTLPSDNTGVFHILEHCVLCGSLKYPLKEPFNQLDKCTLNTYLNAITFADKTLYPIASVNDKDFFKLTDVYLDAVFFPLIKQKKGIFLQEGWNFDGENINGVVYNEMKGVYSTPDAYIDFKVKQNLFGQDGYAFESGGYPEEITDLTYEQFIKTYDEYYNPTNSIIYFYGDLDIDFYLDYLDKEYLSKFEKKEAKIIKDSKNLEKEIYLEDTYFTDDEDLEEKNYIQASFKLKFSKEEDKNIMFDIISDILTENQNGILKKALVDAKICKDVVSYIDDDMKEPIFTILIEETGEKNIDRFKEILEKTIIDMDIDYSLIEGGIVSNEFYFKEKDFGYKPKGLFYNVLLLKNMLYEKYDFDNLKFDDLIEKVRKLDIKQLLLDNLVNNTNCVYAILKPSNQKKQKNKKVFEKDIEDLKAYQQEIDKKEDIDKIKPLDIKDISKEIFKINTQIDEINGMPFIYNIVDTEIAYFNMKVDISDLASDYAKYMSLYVYLVGKLDTKKYKSEELEKQINLIIGSGSSSNTIMSLDGDKFMPVFSLSTRILNNKIKDSFSLLNEIFKNTLFEDKNKIKKLILELLYKAKLDIIKEPKTYCFKRAKSYVCEKGAYIENVEGLEFYFWLKNLCENIDLKLDNIVEKMIYLNNNIFNKDKVFLGACCDKNILQDIKDNIKNLEFITKTNIKFKALNLDINLKNEGYILPIDVNYNTKVSKLDETKYKYKGQVELFKRIIQSQYIWEKIRTEGGAYGGDIALDDIGFLGLLSYSDPNILKTYQNFDKIGSYIQNLSISEKELHMYKIGTINIIDRPLKNNEINKIALYRYFRKLDENTLNMQRLEILDATVKDVKAYADDITNALKTSKICTFGNKQDILKDKAIFENIKTLD